MIGTQIGSYRILEKLGQGGIGEVYKAEDSRLKRLVAIKVLRRDRVAPDQGRLRFRDDCIVMEFAPGPTLAQLLAQQRLTVDQAMDYANQIASALAAAHAARIVHSDIKPGISS